jgi:hypothetical protein
MINFSNAAKRHFSDGLLLREKNRDPNAGQLFGFAAECGIKALLVACGYPTGDDGDLAKGEIKVREHIHKLIPLMDELILYLQGRDGTRYLSQMPNIRDFSDWHTAHRYFTEDSIPASHNNWQNAAREVILMLQNLEIDKGLTCL